jgi:hypothetical protein
MLYANLKNENNMRNEMTNIHICYKAEINKPIKPKANVDHDPSFANRDILSNGFSFFTNLRYYYVIRLLFTLFFPHAILQKAECTSMEGLP